MANALKFYDPTNWKLNLTVSLGDGLSDIAGVYFDGFYFWTIHTTGMVNQYYLTNESTLSKVSSFDTSGMLSDFYAGRCITGDGLDLYVGLQDNVGSGGPPPVYTQTTYIVKVSKSGSKLSNAFAGLNSTSKFGWTDITFDGKDLYGFDDSLLKIKKINVYEEKIVFSTAAMPRTFYGIDFNGLFLYGMRNTGHGHTVDLDGIILTPQIATTIVPYGLSFSNTGFKLPGIDDFDGQWVVTTVRV